MSDSPPVFAASHLARAHAVCAACVGTALTFFLAGVLPLPVLLYFPLSRRFGFEPNPPELAMDYYGRSLLALSAGLFAALGTYLVTMFVYRLRAKGASARASAEGPGEVAASSPHHSVPALPVHPPRSTGPTGLAVAYALTALLLAAGLWAYQLYARLPVPEPLPPGYSVSCTGPVVPREAAPQKAPPRAQKPAAGGPVSPTGEGEDP